MTVTTSAQSAPSVNAKKSVTFSQKTYDAIIDTIRSSSEPLTAAEIHYAVGENYGVKTRYTGIRTAINYLFADGKLIRREESDRERQIRTTEVRGPNSFYYGVAGMPIPSRTRAELPTDPNRNLYINQYHQRKHAEKQAAKKARPAKASAVQTGIISRQEARIAQLEDTVKRLEEQNELLLRVIGKLA
jgi:hypothetical protein